MPDGVKFPSHGYENRSSVLLGNHLQCSSHHLVLVQFPFITRKTERNEYTNTWNKKLYYMLHQLPNELRLRILRNKEMLGKSQNCMGAQPSVVYSLTCRNKYLARALKRHAETDINFFPFCLTLLEYFTQDCRVGINGIGTFQREDTACGRTSARFAPSQIVIQRLQYLEKKFVNLRVSIVSVIAEMLERRSGNICCVQVTRFKGMPVRMIIEKIADYKLFWIGD